MAIKSRARAPEPKSLYTGRINHYNTDMDNNSILIYSASEAAHRLKIGMNKMYQLLESGEVPAIRMGRKWLVPKVALENFLNVSIRKTGGVL